MKTKSSIFLALITAFLNGSVYSESLQDAINRDYEENLAELFLHFHRNPELSFREFETAKRLAQELNSLKIKPR